MANKKIEITYTTSVADMTARTGETQVRKLARQHEANALTEACRAWVAENPETKTIRELLDADVAKVYLEADADTSTVDSWSARVYIGECLYVHYACTMEDALKGLLDSEVSS